jgi:hypothetical protein
VAFDGTAGAAGGAGVGDGEADGEGDGDGAGVGEGAAEDGGAGCPGGTAAVRLVVADLPPHPVNINTKRRQIRMEKNTDFENCTN